MSNNDKFIRDTEFGKLMESQDQYSCIKCKHRINEDCWKMTNEICLESLSYYFAKDKPNETEKV